MIPYNFFKGNYKKGAIVKYSERYGVPYCPLPNILCFWTLTQSVHNINTKCVLFNYFIGLSSFTVFIAGRADGVFSNIHHLKEINGRKKCV